MPVEYPLLKSDWQFIKEAGADDLYAGLQEVAGRLNNYFNRLHVKDQQTDFFQNIYNQVIGQSTAANISRQAGEPKDGDNNFMPDTFLVRWKDGDKSAAQEGKQLFDAFAKVFHTTICSRQGVLGVLYKGMVNTEELPVLIATHILNNHLSDKRYWYLFALLISCVINNRGVDVFCGENRP